MGSIFEGKEDRINFECLEFKMPIAYFSGDAQQANGAESLERVLT